MIHLYFGCELCIQLKASPQKAGFTRIPYSVCTPSILPVFTPILLPCILNMLLLKFHVNRIITLTLPNGALQCIQILSILLLQINIFVIIMSCIHVYSLILQ